MIGVIESWKWCVTPLANWIRIISNWEFEWQNPMIQQLPFESPLKIQILSPQPWHRVWNLCASSVHASCECFVSKRILLRHSLKKKKNAYRLLRHAQKLAFAWSMNRAFKCSKWIACFFSLSLSDHLLYLCIPLRLKSKHNQYGVDKANRLCVWHYMFIKPFTKPPTGQTQSHILTQLCLQHWERVPGIIVRKLI